MHQVDGEVDPVISGVLSGWTNWCQGSKDPFYRIDQAPAVRRNQHAAVVASLLIEGTDGMFGAFATDGRDGQTEAAGAIVDGGSADRMRANGIDPIVALERFDSHTALEASGDLLVTGPTGTNVADLWIAGSAD